MLISNRIVQCCWDSTWWNVQVTGSPPWASLRAHREYVTWRYIESSLFIRVVSIRWVIRIRRSTRGSMVLHMRRETSWKKKMRLSAGEKNRLWAVEKRGTTGQNSFRHHSNGRGRADEMSPCYKCVGWWLQNCQSLLSTSPRLGPIESTSSY